MSTIHVIIPPTFNLQEASERYDLATWNTRRSEDRIRALLAWSRKHRRCGRALPTERPDRRHGWPRGNRPAPGRATTPPSGADVASGGWGFLDLQIIVVGFARMGV